MSQDQSRFSNWAGFGGQSDNRKMSDDSDFYYRWLGQNEPIGRALKLRQDPFAVERPISDLDPLAPRPVKVEEAGSTPGEWIAKTLNNAVEYNPVIMGWDYAFKNFVEPSANDTGVLAEGRRFAHGFYRGATRGGMQTLTNVAAPLTDLAAGDFGKAKSYQLEGNQPGDMSSAAGFGRMLGSFVPDIGLALAGGAVVEGALTGAARTAATAAASGETAGVLTRAGARLAGTWNPALGVSGGLEKTALKLGGVTLPIEATRAARIAQTLAQGGLGFSQTLPQLATGQMSAPEAVANVGLAAAAGPLIAGNMTGGFAKNIAFDTGVNVATGVAQAAVPLIPGGQEFNAEDAWKQILLQTTLGAVTGSASAIADARANAAQAKAAQAVEESRQRVAAEQAAAAAAPPPVEGTRPFTSTGNTFQDVESILYGDTRSTQNMPEGDAAIPLRARAQASDVSEIQTLTADENGNVRSLSDSMITGSPDNIPQGAKRSTLLEASAIERKIYADSVVRKFGRNLQQLVDMFNLDVKPEEMTPEVVSARLQNEVLVQAANGGGIGFAEAKIRQETGQGVIQTMQGTFSIPASAFESGLYTPTEIEQPQIGTVRAAEEPVVNPQRFSDETMNQRYAESQDRLRQSGYVQGPLGTMVPRGSLKSAESWRPSDEAIAGEVPAETIADYNRQISQAEDLSRSTGESVVDILGGPDSPAAQYYRSRQSAGQRVAGSRVEALRGIVDEARRRSAENDTAVQQFLEQRMRESPTGGVGGYLDSVLAEQARNRDLRVKQIEAIEQNLDNVLSKGDIGRKDIRDVKKYIGQVDELAGSLRNEMASIYADINTGRSIDPEYDFTRIARLEEDIARLEALKTVDDFDNADRLRMAVTEQEAIMMDDFEQAGVDTDTPNPPVDASPATAIANRIGRAISGILQRTKNTTESVTATAKRDLKDVGKLIRGQSVEFYAGLEGEAGSKHNAMIMFMSEIAGVEPTFIRTLIRKGQTSFLDGRFEVSPAEGKPGYYNLALKGDDKFKEVIRNSMIKSDVRVEEAETSAKVQEVEAEEQRVSGLESRYSDLEQAYEDDIDPDVEYKNVKGTNATTQIPRPTVSVESPTEVLKSDVNGGKPYADDRATAKTDQQTWLKTHNKKLDKAVSQFIKWAGKNGITNMNAATVRTFLLSKIGPVGFKDLANIALQSNFDEARIRQIQDAFERGVRDKNVTKSLLELQAVSANVPDSYFEARFVDLIPTLNKAVESAQNIAGKLGVDFQDLLRYAEILAAGASPSAKAKVLDRLAQTDIGIENFDEARIKSVIDEAYAGVLKSPSESAVQLDLMRDGIQGTEIPASRVPNGSANFQYAIGKVELGDREMAGVPFEVSGKTNDVYRRRIDQKGTYGGWRWEMYADKLFPETQANTAEVITEWNKIMDWANGKRGADAFVDIINANAYNAGANPYATLARSFPYIVTSGFAGGILLAREYADIKDDETYAGIPGRVLNDLIGDNRTLGYAMMAGGVPVMRSRYKVNTMPGTKDGFRGRIANSFRTQGKEFFRQFTRISEATLPAAEQRARNERWVAENYSTLERGSKEYEEKIAERAAAVRMAHVEDVKLSNFLTKLVGLNNTGTFSQFQQWFNDQNLAGVKSQIVTKFVREPYTAAQGKLREVLNEIASPVNTVIPEILQNLRKNDIELSLFIDAFFDSEYRLSELKDLKGKVDDETYLAKREEIKKDIRDQYFTRNGVVNEKAYNDYLVAQEALNIVRDYNLRANYGKALGIPLYDIPQHKGELIEQRKPLVESIGSLTEAYGNARKQVEALDTAYTKIVKSQGKDQAAQLMPNYKADRHLAGRAMEEYHDTLVLQKENLKTIDKKLDMINRMDSEIAESQSIGYMFRHRDQEAPIVLRLEFDKDTGVASVRREYYNTEDAGYAERLYLRTVLTDAARNKIRNFEGKIADILAKDNITNADYAKIADMEKQIDKLQGMKPVSEMDDVEIFAFAADHKILRNANAPRIIDRTRSGRLTAGSASARKVIEAALSGASTFKASIIGRTTTENALTPRYVDNRGNASLLDEQGGAVKMYKGEEAPSIEDMVDALEAMTDFAIDRQQARQLLERFYTYRHEVKNLNGVTEKVVYVDMAAIRQMAENYIDPAIPNLTKRNNWDGYYNPDGTWTAKQKEKYFIESIEGMRFQIQDYTNNVTVRKSIQQAMDMLDKYRIDNGTREYLTGLLGREDEFFADLGTANQAARKLTRGYSILTLAGNLANMAGNRVYGVTSALTNSYFQGQKVYGVVRTMPNGNDSPVVMMRSKAEADAFIYEREQQGDISYRRVFQTAPSTWFSPRKFGLALGATIAPKTFLNYLAKNDVEWQTALRLVERSKLYEGGVLGSYTIQGGVKSGTKGERAVSSLTYLTSKIEEMNNYTSIIMSVANNRSRSGLTKADFIAMSKGQQTEAMKTFLKPYEDKIRYGAESMAEQQKKVLEITQQIEELSQQPSPANRRRIEQLRRELNAAKKQERRITTPEGAFLDALQNYIVGDRGLEQGNWDSMAKSRFERALEGNPIGVVFLTMSGPALRAMNMWQSLARDAANVYTGNPVMSPNFIKRLGGTGARAKAFAPVFFGAALTTTLLGMYTNPLAVGGMFATDIAAIGEEVFSWFDDDKDDRLTKASKRQYWENVAADLALRYNQDPEQAKKYVRAFWTEGLIKAGFNINVGTGGGFLDMATGPGLEMITKQAKAVVTAVQDVVGSFSSGGDVIDVMYGLTNALPTSAKRYTQAIGFELPMGMKLDKDGNPIIDPESPTLQAKSVTMGEIFMRATTGKPWSETRSKIISMEGGVPLYTEDDKIAFGMSITRTQGVSFGAGLKGDGMKEVQSAQVFAKDAEQLQYLIRNVYENEYEGMVSEAKKRLMDEYNANPEIILPDGNKLSLREMYAIIASDGGLKQEFELKGKGAESVNELALKLAERYGRSLATGQAVANYYQGRVPVSISDSDMYAEYPDDYAVTKLQKKFIESYTAGKLGYEARQQLKR